MLLFFSPIVETRIQEIQTELHLTINVKDMLEEDIENKISARQGENSARKRDIDDWDRDFHINDEEGEVEATGNLSYRMELVVIVKSIGHRRKDSQGDSVKTSH
jgi:hypothetical protein